MAHAASSEDAIGEFRAASKVPFLTLGWWCGLLTFAGLVFNEAIGPVIIFGALGCSLVYCLRSFANLKEAIAIAGWLPWFVPLLALASVVWSSEPDLTLRMSVELCLTTGLVLVAAQATTPRAFVGTAGLVTGLAVLLSLVVRHRQVDGLTGVVSLAGIYTNKNTLGACGAQMFLASLFIALSRGTNSPVRLVSIASCAVGLVTSVAARSVGQLVASMIGGAIIAGYLFIQLVPARQQRVYILCACLVGIVLVAVIPLLLMFAGDDLLRLVGKDSTLTGRTELWYWAARFSDEHPIFGTGYQAFWVPGHSAAEFLWDRFRLTARSGFHFHNLFFEMLVELGWIGACSALIVMPPMIWVVAKWTWLRSSNAAGYYLGLIISLCVVQFQDVNLFQVFSPWYALYLVAFYYGRRAVLQGHA
ncbi:O-antigen ligase family protein [Bradyrhizobium manausense]|uniref:O-antigen ligase family protein n=1 Tax=Bradyrhizobium manausense TaxID=989370 RepID=UPI001BA8284B|nr:O-antigen ligase family protein [Bradyrhizobium manausense]MBR1092284.1 O-antigen ligase family protein [Bradyrhizobium manausense]